MTSFLQVHMLTSYPPANLNRDDTGRPKTAFFGGAERLRVSSQSLKRAWRTSELFSSTVGEYLGIRTQRLGEKILEHLQNSNSSMDPKEAKKIARTITDRIATGGKAPKKEAKEDDSLLTKQLIFISQEERKAAFALADQAVAGMEVPSSKDSILNQADTAIDIAMFGRMLAEAPDYNREASVQVAHAITTHKVTIEDDYYTAIDDLQSRDSTGAGFLGVQEFAAGVFYLYFCIDEDLLIENLNGRSDLAAIGLQTLIEAAAQIAPKGKQASFASRSYAEFILVERGQQQPRSLTAAFLRPVGSAEENGDPMAASIKRLTKFRDSLNTIYESPDSETVDSIEMNRIAVANASDAGTKPETCLFKDIVEFAARYAHARKDK